MAKIDAYRVAPQKGDYPFTPYIYLSISEYSEENGKICVSRKLMTDREIDEVVDRLIKQLETARKKAKRELNTIFL